MRVSMELPGNGYFFALPASVGATDEEITAADHGKLEIARVEQIKFNIQHALALLFEAEPKGRC